MGEKNYRADKSKTSDQRELVGEFIDAVIEDRQKARKMLAAHPELIGARWVHGETVLHFLVIESYAQDEHLLAKAAVSDPLDFDLFPISPAAVEGVRFLAELGADVNAPDEFGDRPIISASMLGNHRMAEILLAHGADPNAESQTVGRAFQCAIRSGNPKLVELLLEAGAKPAMSSDYETIYEALPDDPKKRAAILAVLDARGISAKEDED